MLSFLTWCIFNSWWSTPCLPAYDVC